MITGPKQKKDRAFGFLVKFIFLSMSVILLAISVVFFTVYRELEIKRVTDTSIKNLQQLSMNCVTMFDSISDLAVQIHSDSYITRLVNGIDTDSESIVGSSNRLKSYASSASSIHSIYVYCKQTDQFYTTITGNVCKTRGEFFDSEAVGFIENIQDVRTFHPIPREIAIPGSSYTGGLSTARYTTRVYTLIYYGYPVSSADKFRRVVMINISDDWVSDSIRLWNSNVEGDICIVDQYGNMVSSLSDGLFSGISEEGIADRIIHSEEDAGFFTADVSGEKSYITYAYSSKLGWYFVRALPRAYIYGNIIRIGGVAALLFVLDLSVGFLLAYFITREAKKSIDKIIDDLKEQIRANHCDLDALKEEFLYNNLCNNIACSAVSLRRDLSKYRIGLTPEDPLRLVQFRLDGYARLCGKHKPYDISVLRRGVMMTAMRIFGQRYTVEAVDMKNDHVILIHQSGGTGPYDEHIAGMIRQVQESAGREFGLSLSAVLSSPGHAFMDISLLYNEVRQAAEYRVFHGHQCVIHAQNLEITGATAYAFPIEKEKKLLDTLMLGKVDASMKMLDEILETTRGYHYSILNSLLLRLTASISGAFENIGTTGKYAIDYNFNTFLSVLGGCETLDEIRAGFRGMFSHVFSALEEKRSSKYDQLIHSVIDIINREYASDRICLSSLAAMIDLSPNYLGRIFKVYTAKSVSDYILQIRMENAARLLIESGMSVNDISGRVGFSCSSYFCTVFRKNYGITPSEYRQQTRASIV